MRVQEWLSRISKKVKWVFDGRNKFILRSIDMQGDAIIDLCDRIDTLMLAWSQDDTKMTLGNKIIEINERLVDMGETQAVAGANIYTALNAISRVSSDHAMAERRSKDYAKRLQGKTLEETAKINKIWVQLDTEFGAFKNAVKKYDRLLNDNTKEIDYLREETQSALGNIGALRGQFDLYQDQFKFVDGLHTKVHVSYDKFIDDLREQYHDYLNGLEQAITQFRKSDAAIERLARLEERITIMEIHHRHREQLTNGSGQDSSRPIRTD